MNHNLECPECGSAWVVKVGFVWSGRRKVQQYRCQSCGRLTIKPLEIHEKERGLVPKPA